MKTKPKVGQIYKCRDERHGKRWVRIIWAGKKYVGVHARRGNSRKWIPSHRTIRLGAFTDSKRDYVLVEGK